MREIKDHTADPTNAVTVIVVDEPGQGVDGVKVVRNVRDVSHTPQGITLTETVTVDYFPRCHKLLSDGEGKLWTMNEFGQKNYCSEMKQVREIAY